MCQSDWLKSKSTGHKQKVCWNRKCFVKPCCDASWKGFKLTTYISILICIFDSWKVMGRVRELRAVFAYPVEIVLSSFWETTHIYMLAGERPFAWTFVLFLILCFKLFIGRRIYPALGFLGICDAGGSLVKWCPPTQEIRSDITWDQIG